MGVLITFIGAILFAILIDDFKEWMGWVAQRITLYAASSAPKSWRERLAEEWSSELADTPGVIAKLIQAIGFLLASIRIRKQKRESNSIATKLNRMASKIAHASVPPFPKSQLGRIVGDLICLASLGRIRYPTSMKIVTWISVGEGSWIANLLFILFLSSLFTPLSFIALNFSWMALLVWLLFRATPFYGLLR